MDTHLLTQGLPMVGHGHIAVKDFINESTIHMESPNFNNSIFMALIVTCLVYKALRQAWLE